MLIDEIIQLLGDEKCSLSSALLKTKILLHEIGKKELAEWVNNELNGYAEDAELPKYRILNAQVLVNACNPAYQISSHPIPLRHLTNEQRERLEHARMGQSLSALEDMLASEGGSSIAAPIPMEYNTVLGKGLGNGYQIQNAWCQIALHDLRGLLTQVRSRLLDFVLALRDEIGSADDGRSIKEKAASVDTAGLFNNAIFGANTTIIVGDNNIQGVKNGINKGDLPALLKALKAVNLPAEEVQLLKDAIEEDSVNGGKPSFDGKTGAWFTQLLGRAAKGTVAIGVDVVSSTISKVLTGYLGAG